VTDFPDNFLSESFAVACDLDEGDFLEVYRIGDPGEVASVLSVSAVVQDLEAAVVDGQARAKASIMLTPQAARQVAIWLINLADECEGIETSFFPLDQIGEIQ
jgi:hypothetical protein